QNRRAVLRYRPAARARSAAAVRGEWCTEDPIGGADSVQWEDPRPWPELKHPAVRGLVEEGLTTLYPHTEADGAALLLEVLVAFGNVIGDGPHAVVGGVTHPARLFGCTVGRTSKGRKGQAHNDVGQFFRLADPMWWQNSRISGLGSGEGLIARVRDQDEGPPVD